MQKPHFAIFLGLTLLGACSATPPQAASTIIVSPQPLILGGKASTPPADPYASTQTPAKIDSCGSEMLRPVTVCQPNQALLCVDTPAGGVVTDYALVRGTIDRKGYAFGGLVVKVQHLATKALVALNTQTPQASCHNAVLTHESPYCLDAQGYFGLRIPLSQLGSYTVNVQALQIGGAPQVQTVMISRVVEPTKFVKGALSDTVTIGERQGDHVQIAVNLLGDCPDCDLIGSQTGGTLIQATNRIGQQQVVRRSDLGAQGQYQLCMPLGAGENDIEVKACNAAAPQCVVLKKFSQAMTVTKTKLSWQQPEALQNDAILTPQQWSAPFELRFSLNPWQPAAASPGRCAGGLDWEWNSQPSRVICPDANGYFVVSGDTPHVGVNYLRVHGVSADGTILDQQLSFGWGVVQPLTQALPTVSVSLDKMLLTERLPQLINGFLASDQFSSFLKSILEVPPPRAGEETVDAAVAARLQKIRAEIPKCGPASSSATKIKIMGQPRLGKAHVDHITLSQNTLALDLQLEDFVLQFQAFKDDNHDGAPDKGVLPLKISFKRWKLQPQIKLIPGNKPLVLVTSADDDCQFKSGSYCKHQPAIVQPKNFVGGINSAGSFLVCDSDEQLLDADTRILCKAMNNINSQNGIISERIIDTLNETLYCDLSARLTDAVRSGVWPLQRQLTVGSRHLDWQLDVSPHPSALSLDDRGLRVGVATRAPQGTGTLIVAPGDAKGVSAAVTQHQVGLAVHENVFNQILALLVHRDDGILDWNLDEAFLTTLGANYAQCDQAPGKGQTLPAYCPLRLRVSELLGSDLSKENYYSPQQPLRLKIKGNRKISPDLRFRQSTDGKQLVDLALPNLEIQFLATYPDQSHADADIATMRATILLTLELVGLQSYPTDPSQNAVNVRIHSYKVAFAAVPGSNRTLIPDANLISKLNISLQIALDNFKTKEGFLLPFPKAWAIAADGDTESLLSRLGLAELRVDAGGLSLGVDGLRHSLYLGVTPTINH